MPIAPIGGVACPSQLSILYLGCTLQRLFSTFPNSWPGIGLLLLRGCLAAALIYFGASSSSEPISFASNVVAIAGAVLLLAGLWTPVVGALAALDEICIGLLNNSQWNERTWIHIFLAIFSISVTMLGPGAWSIDAQLFGRKRFDIDRSRGRKPSL